MPGTAGFMAKVKGDDSPSRASIDSAFKPPLYTADEVVSHQACHGPFRDGPSLDFIRYRGHLRPKRRVKLRNDLLAAIGFIELANAGDFAANVWNTAPLPTYTVALMAIGGIVALGVLWFAVKDAILSWQNICGLCAERRYLHRLRREKENLSDRDVDLRSIDCFLGVNFREMGTEIVDRFGMDTLMGFGALVVGCGTFMAIAGAKPKVFMASNLLTGYIGNSPCALYGIINLMWSAFVWIRARNHTTATMEAIQGTELEKRFKLRSKQIRTHSSINGLTGIVAGAASLATYTQWWAYVILCPCLVSSVLLNIFWRHRVGYDRPFVYDLTVVDKDSLVTALDHAHCSRKFLEKHVSPTREAASILFPDAIHFTAFLDFFQRHNLFEDFCLRLVQNVRITEQLFAALDGPMQIDMGNLVSRTALECELSQVARQVINEEALRCFNYEERWLFEALGCYMTWADSPGEKARTVGPGLGL